MMTFQRIVVTNISEFISRLVDFSQGDRGIWYRGQEFHHYYLEPSAYRYPKYTEDSKLVEERSILAAQSDMLHITETRNLNTNLDWLCYLQHNGTPTRLLDWTFEFRVALYFAFEDYLKDKAKPGSLPSVWAFRPKVFMKTLINFIRNENLPFGIKPDQQDIVIELLEDAEPKGTKIISNFEIENHNLVDDMYVPFISPYVNERAKMQGGCFIRFPLLNKAKIHRFREHRLENFVSSYPIFSDCLAKFIFIYPEQSLSELSILNLNTSRIYPEVENIAIAIKTKLFET